MPTKSFLNPWENERENQLGLTATFLKLWLVFALAVLIIEIVNTNYTRAIEEFFRVLCPPLLFLFLLSRTKSSKIIPWVFYYPLIHINLNVFLRPDTFALDVFLVLPIVLPAAIAMRRRQVMWYSAVAIVLMSISFAIMEFYHNEPVAISVAHRSKNVYLIILGTALSAVLLNHFKSLYNKNLKQLDESLKTLKSFNRDNQMMMNLITHDINNQLGRLLMSVEFLDDAIENPDEFKKFHEQAVDGVMDIRDIIFNFKLLRGDEEEGLDFKVKEIKVSSVLQKIEMIFKTTMIIKQIKLVKMIHEGVDTVAVEPISFSHHIMANFMGNAVKFSADESEIEIQVQNEKDQVRIDITNMCGPEHRKNLENMKQKKKVLSKKGTRNEHGQGIGMKLVDQLGKYSNLRWEMNWSEEESGMFRVTNTIWVPAKIKDALKNSSTAA